MKTLQISTSKKREVIDITDQIVELPEGEEGVVSLFIQHTTAALTVMDLDPGTDKDFLDFLESLVPDADWRHPHNPSHTPDHLLASLIGPSVQIPFAKGKLQLGMWQRVVLVELDGPRERSIVASFHTQN